MNFEKYSNILKAISHPVRLQIVYGLNTKENCNVQTMTENLKLSQPIVSQHLAVLRRAEIVDTKRNGTKICYYISDKTVKKIINSIL